MVEGSLLITLENSLIRGMSLFWIDFALFPARRSSIISRGDHVPEVRLPDSHNLAK
jgi:hypothetical protein